MVTLRTRTINPNNNSEDLDQLDEKTPVQCRENNAGSGYEKRREERIRENLQRMQKLGIINLSMKLSAKKPSYKLMDKSLVVRKTAINSLPPRRSSRLQNATPVSYVELPSSKTEKLGYGDSLVSEGLKHEIYTEEHEKLLGSSSSPWTLFQDGYGPDGKRIYDQVKGKTCHQCRQKTLGLRTFCSNCQMIQGQFCGDCLYMRYGENVLEANRNPNWICPVCRGICNCSLCRIKKGWAPTGSMYKRVVHLGFKSVAHYLIQTRRSQTNSGDQVSDQKKEEEMSPVSSARRCLSFIDTEHRSDEEPYNLEFKHD